MRRHKGKNGPGPVGGGELRGYLWSESGAETTFDNVTDMESWLNKRLTIAQIEALDLKQYELVMCHMDLEISSYRLILLFALLTRGMRILPTTIRDMQPMADLLLRPCLWGSPP